MLPLLDISSFRDRLLKPLPGKEAQMTMMPKLSDTTRFNLSSKGDAIPGGVLVLLYPYQGELHMPFMLRPDYGGVHSGQVSFPGGKKEDGDIDLIRTALRESNEELGIPDDKVEVIGILTELYIIASNYKVLPVVGFLDHRPSFNPDPREVVEIIEAPLSLLQSEHIIKEGPFMARSEFEIVAPYFDINNHRVWGATAMMLSEFLTVFKDL